MQYKYGEFTSEQIKHTKKSIQKKIFFLLLIVDPETKSDHKNINVIDAFTNIQHTLGGLNSILGEPIELVNIISLIEAALIEYTSPDFNTDDFRHSAYRKLILDAGSEVEKIKEV